MVIIFAPLLPYALLALICDIHNRPPRSLAPGKEFVVPANSRMPVTVAKDHRVRF